MDVSSGVDHVIYDERSNPIDQGGYGIISYESEGLYLVITSFPEGGNGGLWLLDPNSGSLQQIAPRNKPTGSRHGFYLIGAGAAWYGDVAPGDQDPPGRIDPMDEVLRFDLKSRVVTAWFRRPGTQVGVGANVRATVRNTADRVRSDRSGNLLDGLLVR